MPKSALFLSSHQSRNGHFFFQTVELVFDHLQHKTLTQVLVGPMQQCTILPFILGVLGGGIGMYSVPDKWKNKGVMLSREKMSF